MYSGISVDFGPPWRPALSHRGNGGPSAESDGPVQQCKSQTSPAPHRVHSGEASYQLDVHLSVWLSQ
ncbi:hypothetical protein M9458_009512, partial [Cirrhinus mrigala]